MYYYSGQPVRFVENSFVDVNLLRGFPVEDGSYIGYRTDYSNVEEIVDRKYWQPSSVTVSQVGKHASSTKGLYDSPEILKSTQVASVNASIRHPSNDIVDTNRRVQQLKKITIEVAEADVKAQLEKAEADRKATENNLTIPNSVSTPPDTTQGA